MALHSDWLKWASKVRKPIWEYGKGMTTYVVSQELPGNETRAHSVLCYSRPLSVGKRSSRLRRLSIAVIALFEVATWGDWVRRTIFQRASGEFSPRLSLVASIKRLLTTSYRNKNSRARASIRQLTYYTSNLFVNGTCASAYRITQLSFAYAN